MTRKMESRFMAFEKKILRRKYGSMKVEDAWRIRKYQELGELFNITNIQAEIKSRRLRFWLILRKLSGLVM